MNEKTRSQRPTPPSLGVRLVNVLKRFPSNDYTFSLIMGLVIGVVGGYGAVGFRLAIEFVGHLVYQSSEPTFEYLLSLPWYWRFAIPVLGGLIVGPIVTYFASEAKGHGVPEVMAAVATRGGIIRGRVAAAKVAASAVTIGTGGSAGSEGPIVQIGSAIASSLGQLMKLSARKMKTFVGCGAAAGIAATFNAPVAGMLFSLEIVLGSFAVSSISPIIVASVTATAISRRYLGDAPAFEVPSYTLVGPIELIHYAVLGVVAAAVAVLFTKVLDRSETFFERLRVPDALKPAIGGLIMGLLGAAGLTHVYGVGYEFIESALRGELAVGLIAVLIVAKILATSATLGSGGSGGILAPSLLLGALTGGLVWFGAHAVTPGLVGPHHGAFSLVGMAALVGAATHAPLQAILILFELTGGYEVILPLMLATTVAVIFAKMFMEESIYTVKLKAKGINLRHGQEVNVLRGLKTGDIMRTEVLTAPDNLRLRPLLDIISESANNSTVFLLDREGKLMGNISFHEVRRVLFDLEALEPVLVAADIAELDPVTVSPEDTLDVVIELFARQNLDELPVVDPNDPGTIIGSVHRSDVVDTYNHEILKRDLISSVSSTLAVTQKVQSSPIMPGYSMAEVEVPSEYAGKDLRSLQLRNRLGIEILLVRRRSPDKPGNLENVMPTGDLVLQHGDVMLINGPQEVVHKLANR